MDDALERNEATARRLRLLPFLVPGLLLDLALLVVAWLVGGPLVALLVVVIIAVTLPLGQRNLRRAGPRIVVAAVGARRVTDAEEPRLHNLVEGLCVGIGLTPPELWIAEDDAPNALATAVTVDEAQLVVTTGLLARLPRIELEAVVAHELARIRSGDALVGALAVPTLGGFAALRDVPGLGTLRFDLWLPLAAAPITRALVGRGEPVEAWTDLAAVDITRYPPALASALATLAQADPAVPPSAGIAAAHLWIHGARAEGAYGEALARVYEIAPPSGSRIEVLEAL